MMHASFKNDYILVKKVKDLHKYCPASGGTTFGSKFVLDTKLQISISWNASKLGLCGNSLALNMSDWVNECVFWNTKINRK